MDVLVNVDINNDVQAAVDPVSYTHLDVYKRQGLRYARMLGIRNMWEQCVLTAAVQNIKRLVASLLYALIYLTPACTHKRRGLSVV